MCVNGSGPCLPRRADKVRLTNLCPPAVSVDPLTKASGVVWLTRTGRSAEYHQRIHIIRFGITGGLSFVRDKQYAHFRLALELDLNFVFLFALAGSEKVTLTH